MNNIRLFSVLLISFFTFLIKPCTSFQLDVHPSLITSLPGKLKFTEKATKTGKHIETQMKAKEETMGGLKKKIDVRKMQITRAKWKEWEETHDPSDLFTMDYRRVRRRRPIHNKSLRP